MDQVRRECSGPSNGPGAEVGYDFFVLLDVIAVLTHPDLTPILLHLSFIVLGEVIVTACLVIIQRGTPFSSLFNYSIHQKLS
jgi:hypothetical protein